MIALKRFLFESNMTQADLARALGVSQASVSFYINGKHRPRPGLAIQLERLTGIPVAALLDGPKEPGELQ